MSNLREFVRRVVDNVHLSSSFQSRTDCKLSISCRLYMWRTVRFFIESLRNAQAPSSLLSSKFESVNLDPTSSSHLTQRWFWIIFGKVNDTLQYFRPLIECYLLLHLRMQIRVRRTANSPPRKKNGGLGGTTGPVCP